MSSSQNNELSPSPPPPPPLEEDDESEGEIQPPPAYSREESDSSVQAPPAYSREESDSSVQPPPYTSASGWDGETPLDLEVDENGEDDEDEDFDPEVLYEIAMGLEKAEKEQQQKQKEEEEEKQKGREEGREESYDYDELYQIAMEQEKEKEREKWEDEGEGQSGLVAVSALDPIDEYNKKKSDTIVVASAAAASATAASGSTNFFKTPPPSPTAATAAASTKSFTSPLVAATASSSSSSSSTSVAAAAATTISSTIRTKPAKTNTKKKSAASKKSQSSVSFPAYTSGASYSNPFCRPFQSMSFPKPSPFRKIQMEAEDKLLEFYLDESNGIIRKKENKRNVYLSPLPPIVASSAPCYESPPPVFVNMRQDPPPKRYDPFRSSDPHDVVSIFDGRRISCMKISPDGQYIVICGDAVCQVSEINEIGVFTAISEFTEAFDALLMCCCFNPGSSKVAAASVSGGLVVNNFLAHHHHHHHHQDPTSSSSSSSSFSTSRIIPYRFNEYFDESCCIDWFEQEVKESNTTVSSGSTKSSSSCCCCCCSFIACGCMDGSIRVIDCTINPFVSRKYERRIATAWHGAKIAALKFINRRRAGAAAEDISGLSILAASGGTVSLVNFSSCATVYTADATKASLYCPSGGIITGLDVDLAANSFVVAFARSIQTGIDSLSYKKAKHAADIALFDLQSGKVKLYAEDLVRESNSASTLEDHVAVCFSPRGLHEVLVCSVGCIVSTHSVVNAEHTRTRLCAGRKKKEQDVNWHMFPPEQVTSMDCYGSLILAATESGKIVVMNQERDNIAWLRMRYVWLARERGKSYLAKKCLSEVWNVNICIVKFLADSSIFMGY